MVIFWDSVSFSILLLLATLPELYFLTFFQKHLISPLASFDASASACKIFHSSALNSEHFWTSLGTFSWAHEQLLSEACYNCTKKICFARFFVWFRKVIIPARHRRNMAFLSLWNTSLVSFWQAVHNAPIQFTQTVNMAVVVTVNTRAINNIIWQLNITQQAVCSLPVIT